MEIESSQKDDEETSVADQEGGGNEQLIEPRLRAGWTKDVERAQY